MDQKLKKNMQKKLKEHRQRKRRLPSLVAGMLVVILTVNSLVVPGAALSESAARESGQSTVSTEPAEVQPPAESNPASPIETGPSEQQQNSAETAQDDLPDPPNMSLGRQILQAELGNETCVIADGCFPEGAELRAEPAEDVELEGQRVLLAVDVTILLPDGSAYEPQGGEVSVEIRSPEIEAEDSNVYYIPETGKPEEMDTTAEKGSVSFDTRHFSVYAVAASLPGYVEKEGTVQNKDGTEFTWKKTRDKILWIEGSGPMPEAGPWEGMYCEKIVIGEGITEIAPNAFTIDEDDYYKYSLTVDLPGTLKIIHQSAFRGQRVVDLQLPSSLEKIEADAFNLLQDETLNVPEGVIYIGDYAFGKAAVAKLTLPDSLEEIGESAFRDCTNLKTVHFGQGLKKLGKYAFANCPLTEADLPDSVETMEYNAFWKTDIPGTFHIPASLTDAAGVPCADSYEVSASSLAVTLENGVPYLKKDGGQRVMLGYPKEKEDAAFTVPADVGAVSGGAFRHNPHLRSLTIQTPLEIYSYLFISPSLEEVELPDKGDSDGRLDLSFAWEKCPQLKKVNIPAGYRQVLLDRALDGMHKNLQEIRYNATCAYFDTASSGSCFGYYSDSGRPENLTVTVGKDVRRLDKDFVQFARVAKRIRFEPGCEFTVQDDALQNQPEPLTGLAGLVHVDDTGITYSVDPAKRTAKVILCPEDPVSLTVPAQITLKNGTQCAVTAVGGHALNRTSRLQELTFADASQLVLEDWALANCPTLKEVNHETSQEGAAALFAEGVGNFAFWNTGLTSGLPVPESMETTKKISVEMASERRDEITLTVSENSQSPTLQWNSGEKRFDLLTGDTMQVKASAGNTGNTGKTVYRIYVQKDPLCTMNYEVGKTYFVKGKNETSTTIFCRPTQSPDVVCLEFSLDPGVTVGLPIDLSYPTPASPGGSVRVWATVSEGVPNQGATVPLKLAAEGCILGRWSTGHAPFTLSKRPSDSKKIKIVSSQESGKTVGRFDQSLIWNIYVNRLGDEDPQFGRDHVRNLHFEDAVTLPDGMSWDPVLLNAVKNGTYEIVRVSGNYNNRVDVQVDGKTYLQVWDSWTYMDMELRPDSTGKNILIVFDKANQSYKTHEISAKTIYLSILPQSVQIHEVPVTEPADGWKVKNHLDCTVQYMHGADDELHADAERVISLEQPGLRIYKENIPGTRYMGSPAGYKITVKNPSLHQWNKLPQRAAAETNYVKDDLNNMLYLTLADMEEMFCEAEDAHMPLTIYVNRIYFSECAPAMAADGTMTAHIHCGNSDMKKVQGTLTIQWDGRNYHVKKTESGHETESSSGASLSAIWDSVDPHIFQDTTFSCRWQLPDTIDAGKNIVLPVRSTLKDTFMALPRDLMWQCRDVPTWCKNKATLSENNHTSSVEDKGFYREPEAWFVKALTIGGESNFEKPESLTGDTILDYSLGLGHDGSGAYRDLPLVDTMTGTQCLLVPKDRNPQLAGKGLTEFQSPAGDGPYYYRLDQPGTYENVRVGHAVLDGPEKKEMDMVAASITVAADQVSLQTTIKWYFTGLPGEFYGLRVHYKAAPDVGRIYENHWAWNLGNTGWANDRKYDRLYDTIGNLTGRYLAGEKNIVTERGKTPEGDVLTQQSGVGPGDTVLYRLEIRQTEDAPIRISGRDIVDQLPLTTEDFSWNEENLKVLDICGSENAKITHRDQWLHSWRLSSSPDGYAQGDHLQYLTWPETAEVEFGEEAQGTGAVYLYVQLTFPEDKNGLWEKYVIDTNGAVKNTAYLAGMEDSVEHILEIQGKVLLQKGVIHPLKQMQDRQAFDIVGSGMRFYILLANPGYSRLYLSEIQDILPQYMDCEGLCPAVVGPKSGEAHMWTTPTLSPRAASRAAVELGDLQLKVVDIFPNKSLGCQNPSGQHVYFRIRQTKEPNGASVDPANGQLYLNHNEAILFAYEVSVHGHAEMPQKVFNTVGMPYTDCTGQGVRLATPQELSAVSADNPACGYINQNDGSRELTEDGSQTQFGLPEGNDKWLVSRVELHRNQIVPGITKITESRTPAGSDHSLPYEGFADTNDTITWNIHMTNSGDQTISHYVLRDIMPYPYVFAGDVGYILTVDDVVRPKDENTPGTVTVSLLWANEIVRKPQDGVEKLGRDTYRIRADGKPVSLRYPGDDPDDAVAFSFRGNDMVMELYMNGLEQIPKHGSNDLKVSGKYESPILESRVFTNKVELEPCDSQPFLTASQGTIRRDESGQPKLLEAVAPVAVTFGYTTSADKQVFETDDPGNCAAASDPDHNRIRLPGCDTPVTYTLEVHNTKDLPMTKLVMIDNLPQVNDGSVFDPSAARNSQFRIDLAEDPDFRVEVVTADGTVTALTDDRFTVDYSTSTSFPAHTADWKGDATEKWTANAAGARAFRIVLKDETGALIPKESTVRVHFNAVPFDAEYGETSWNSFGYHYALEGVASEMEAVSLNAGVQSPALPQLAKVLQDVNGEPQNAETDHSFRFKIKDDTVPANERIVTLTVPAGSSTGEIVLQLPEWEWDSEKTYTISELDPGADWETSSWQGGSICRDGSMTFRFDPKKDLLLICTNRFRKWDLEILKQDGEDHQPLENAAFALYTSNPSDQMTDADYEALNEKPIRCETAGGTDWYLMKSGITGANGKLRFSGLTEEEYRLAEIRPPDGYEGAEPRIIRHTDSEVQVTVDNHKGYLIPESGGIGTGFRYLGLTVCAVSLAGTAYKMRKRKGVSDQ